MNDVEQFRVRPGDRVNLKGIDPDFKDRHESREAADGEIEHYQQKLRELQELFFAERRHSLS